MNGTLRFGIPMQLCSSGVLAIFGSREHMCSGDAGVFLAFRHICFKIISFTHDKASHYTQFCKDSSGTYTRVCVGCLYMYCVHGQSISPFVG
jgi:hypothetical protein